MDMDPIIYSVPLFALFFQITYMASQYIFNGLFRSLKFDTENQNVWNSR